MGTRDVTLLFVDTFIFHLLEIPQLEAATVAYEKKWPAADLSSRDGGDSDFKTTPRLVDKWRSQNLPTRLRVGIP